MISMYTDYEIAQPNGTPKGQSTASGEENTRGRSSTKKTKSKDAKYKKGNVHVM